MVTSKISSTPLLSAKKRRLALVFVILMILMRVALTSSAFAIFISIFLIFEDDDMSDACIPENVNVCTKTWSEDDVVDVLTAVQPLATAEVQAVHVPSVTAEQPASHPSPATPFVSK